MTGLRLSNIRNSAEVLVIVQHSVTLQEVTKELLKGNWKKHNKRRQKWQAANAHIKFVQMKGPVSKATMQLIRTDTAKLVW